LAFSNPNVRHAATHSDCVINIKRIHDADGEVTVKYKTIEIDQGDRTARSGVDFEKTEGILTFGHNETQKEIVVKILEKELLEGEERDEIFGIKLFDPTNGVKISKRDVCHVELVKDAKSARQAQALQSLLKKIENEEKTSWSQQIKNAIMLHPTKEENGEINDVSCGDAVLHFLSIGWKVLFAIANPPPHRGGGYPTLVSGITCIGFVTYVVAEIATLVGCIMKIEPGLTAITFVAIGTSLPDTFASMTAARNSRYADEAVGNITGSNCVNVFLGLGLPWLIGTIWKLNSK